MNLGIVNALICLQNGSFAGHPASGIKFFLIRNFSLSSFYTFREEACLTQECSTLTNLLEHGSLSSLSRLGTEHHGIDVED